MIAGKRGNITIFVVVISIACCASFAQTDPGTSRIATWKGDATAAYSMTWDDASTDRVTASQICDQYGLKATLFCNTRYLMDHPSYAALFKSASDRGHELGSHSVDHIDLTKLTEEEIRWQLQTSKDYLESLTGKPVVSLAYPYGLRNQTVLNIARELYLDARTTVVGPNTRSPADMLQLKFLGLSNYGRVSDAVRIADLRQRALNLASSGGWGIQMFHNLWTYNEGVSYQTAAALQGHLADLVSPDFDFLWIAPEGVVTRYITERDNTTVSLVSSGAHRIELMLGFDGNSEVFNEPLTVLTYIPAAWDQSSVHVFQADTPLDVSLVSEPNGTYAMYDAMPGGALVTLVGAIVTDVPEPSAMAIVMLVGLALLRRRRKTRCGAPHAVG